MQMLPNEIMVDVDVDTEEVDKPAKKQNWTGWQQEQSNKVSAGNKSGSKQS